MDKYGALAEELQRFVPEETARRIAGLIIDHNVQLTITPPRKTKLGDYRPPLSKPFHRISVNGDLNIYAFLLVFLHEFAHLLVWEDHREKVKSHGDEWKKHFRALYGEYRNAFTEDLQSLLDRHFNKLSATLSRPELIRELIHLDSDEPLTLVSDLSGGDVFDFNGKRFEIIHKRRTRFLCKGLSDGRKYLVPGAAVVNRVIR